MIPLDKNESYWLLDDELVAACSALGAKEFSTYPDYTELKKRLVEYAGVSVEQLSLAPGSDAAIESLAEMCGTGEVLLPVPTFYGYESILARAGAHIVPIYYQERDDAFEFPLAETLAHMERKTAKALFLCQPNNPLGCRIPEAMMSAMLGAAKGSEMLVVVDEAYFEFSGVTLASELASMPNLVILRTLSKGFGLSGARVGYVLAAPAIIAQLEARLLPWPVAHPSVFAALALLAQRGRVAERRAAIIAARDELAVKLRTFPNLTVYPSETNFLLVRVPDAALAQSALRDAGIRVALGEPMSRYPEAAVLLRETLRIAVPGPADEAQLLTALGGCTK